MVSPTLPLFWAWIEPKLTIPATNKIKKLLFIFQIFAKGMILLADQKGIYSGSEILFLPRLTRYTPVMINTEAIMSTARSVSLPRDTDTIVAITGCR